MDNAEEIMQSLEEFSKLKPKDIPHELDDYLGYVAKTGDPVFKWSIIKCLFREKLLSVVTDFYESTLNIELPPCPNVDPFNYERMKANLLEKIDSFHGAPFTVQRISELLTNPRKEYNRADKFMRAIEKNILVVSTREPGRFAEGECEADASYNGIQDGNDSGVETAFTCNDIADPDSSSHSYEVSTENIEPAYSVTVDAASEPSGAAITSEAPPHEDVFVTTPPQSEQEIQRTDIPGTSAEMSENIVASDTKEAETVICSTVPSPQETPQQQTVDAISSIVEEPSGENIVDPQEEVDTVPAETTVASTSEPTTSEIESSSIVEEEPSISQSGQGDETLSVEEEPAPSSSEPESVNQATLDISEPEPSLSNELPTESTTPESQSNAEEAPQEVAKDETVDKEVVKLSCTEPTSFEDDRPVVECDTSNEICEPVETPEKEHAEVTPAEEATVSMPTSDASATPTDPIIPDENEVSSCSDVVEEAKPMESEATETGIDQTREASVIHTTSSDEPMEVDECPTTSTEETLS